MPRKTQPKGDSPRMRKMIVTLPEDLHRQLKIRAAEQDSTVREIVTRAIERELEKGGKRKTD
jgi:plasmid stability protein